MPTLTVSKGTIVELPGNRGQSIVISVLECGDDADFCWVRVSTRHPTSAAQSYDSLMLHEVDSAFLLGYGTYMSVVEPTADELEAGVVPLCFRNGKAGGVRYYRPEKKESRSRESRHTGRRQRSRHVSPDDKPGLKSRWAQEMEGDE